MKKKILIVVTILLTGAVISYFFGWLPTFDQKNSTKDMKKEKSLNETPVKKIAFERNNKMAIVKMTFQDKETGKTIVIDRLKHDPFQGDIYPPVKEQLHYKTVYDVSKINRKALEERFPPMKKRKSDVVSMLSYSLFGSNKAQTHVILQYDLAFYFSVEEASFGVNQFEIYGPDGLIYKSEETYNAYLEPELTDDGRFLCFICLGDAENCYSEKSYHFFDTQKGKLIYIEPYDLRNVKNRDPFVRGNVIVLPIYLSKEEKVYHVFDMHKMIKYSYHFPVGSSQHNPTSVGVPFKLKDGSQYYVTYENDFEKTKINEL